MKLSEVNAGSCVAAVWATVNSQMPLRDALVLEITGRFPRTSDKFAKLAPWLTVEIARVIEDNLEPLGVTQQLRKIAIMVPEYAVKIALEMTDRPDRAVEIAEAVPDKAVEIAKALPSLAVSIALAVPDKAVEIAEVLPNQAVEIATKIPDKAVEIAKALTGQAVEIAKAVPEHAVEIALAIPGASDGIQDLFKVTEIDETEGTKGKR